MNRLALSRRLAALGAAAALVPSRARAQVPPLRIIVPYAPGGTGDVVGRLLAERLGPLLGRACLVESRPGAGGNVGAAYVAAAPPDGSVLLLGAVNNFAINQYLYRAMPFDPATAFASVSLLADVPSVILTNGAADVTTLEAFIATARRQPDALNYASPGTGTAPQLGTELFAREAGIRLVHIPYGSGGAAVTALLKGEVQLYLLGYGVARPLIEAGQIRALAVAAPQRLAPLPTVPTTGELGLPNVLVSNWWGLAAPRATPAAVLDPLASAVHAAMADPALRARLTDLGYLPVGDSPAAMDATIRADAARYAALIRALGITLD